MRALQGSSRKVVSIIVLAGVTALLSGSAWGDIVITGSVEPVYGGMGGDTWDVDGGMVVGYQGDGTLSIPDGGSVTVTGGSTLIGSSDAAYSGVTGTVQLTGDGSAWTLDPNEDFVIGPLAKGYLSVGAGTTVSSGDAVIGGHPVMNEQGQATGVVAGEGHVTVSGGQWDTGDWGWLVVGAAGTGELAVEDGGQVTGDTAIMAIMPDAVGNVSVSDPCSTWALTKDLVVGAWGDATLRIENGGQVQSQTGWVGGTDPVAMDFNEPVFDGLGNPTGSGSVVVTGTGARWDVNDKLVVGAWGMGDVTIEDHGQVTAGEAYIGGMPTEIPDGEEFSRDMLADGEGTMTVTGDGTLTVTSDHTLFVGYSGTGRLDVSGGGDVVSPSVVIGGAPDANGTIVVSGTGSTLSAEYEIDVGVWGTGHLTVADQGAVSTGNLLIGGLDSSDINDLPQEMLDDFGEATGTGTVTVGGGGTLDASRTTYVGNYGQGTLNVTEGGHVTSGEIAVGVAPDSHGIVSVTGPNAHLETDANAGVEEDGYYPGVMIVGGYGLGEATVSNGGQLTVDDVLYVGGYKASELDFNSASVGHEPDGTGTVTVTGAGSSLSADILAVGAGGQGTVSVLDGASATSRMAMIGITPDGRGDVIVDNSGDTWTNTGSAFVGGYGQGTLTVSNGGHARIQEILYVGGFNAEVFDFNTAGYGYDPNGTGTVTVTGSESLLQAYGMGVGIAGNGTLEIFNGGQVEGQVAVVGAKTGSTGSVVVDGEGSTLHLGGDSPLPDDLTTEGEGSVVISNGGAVNLDGNAMLAVGGDITVGSEGEGTMTVSGGTVTTKGLYIGGSYVGEAASAQDAATPPTGTVTVTGQYASLDVTGEFPLMVGYSGTGTLNVNDDAHVTTGSMVVGGGPDVTGTVAVDAGHVAADHDIIVGAWGNGNMTIDNGGTVTAGEVFIGGFDENDAPPEMVEEFGDALGTGNVMVTGNGSSLQVAGDQSLYVGYSGGGGLAVNLGGYVSSETAGIGVEAGSQGGVVVAGHDDANVPSTWDNSGSMYVGGYGEGSLRIENGGRMHIGEDLYIGGYDPEKFGMVAQPVGAEPNGTGTVTVTGAGSLLDVTGMPTTYVGYSGDGTLYVFDEAQVNTDTMIVGGGPGATGTVIVEDVNSTLSVSNNMVVGAWGQGNAAVSEGGRLTTGGLYIGGFNPDGPGVDPALIEELGEPNGTGTVIVTGAGSSLQITDVDSLVVGMGGTGHLTVSDGADVNSTESFIGGYLTFDYNDATQMEDAHIHDGTGDALVTGAGSTWRNDVLIVGTGGSGTLDVTDGGQVSSYLGGVGFGPDASGRVTVSGPNSVWTNAAGDTSEGDPYNGTLIVGGWGNGDLMVSNGGRVNAITAYIGGFDLAELGGGETPTDWGPNVPAGPGTVTVTGQNSVLQVVGGNTTYVGYSGDGTLAILNGGQVISDAAIVGVTATGTGTVTVDGNDSTWSIVGGGGASGLSAQGHGQVTISNGGLVEVNGADAMLAVGGRIAVGSEGRGAMTISGAGEVLAQDVYIGGAPAEVQALQEGPGPAATGTGTVVVTGDGSKLDVAEYDSLYVGYSGHGVLDVNDGGRVDSVTAGIAALPGSTGSATVDGVHSNAEVVASQWFNSGSMFVGGYGSGSLTISNGGVADVMDTLYVGGFNPDRFGIDTEAVGHEPNGTGMVTVTGAGSTLWGSGLRRLYVGYSGTGLMDVNDGGYVESGQAFVGSGAGSTGAMTVTGEDSRFVVNGMLHVGAGGTGTLDVNDGATVTSHDAYIGSGETGSGTVTVRGEGSHWTTADYLMVGWFGHGTLTVSDGGRVDSDEGYIGYDNSGDGAVRVTGDNSIWNVNGNLFVGGREGTAAGTGLLTVRDGGEVRANELTVWSTGTLTGDGTVTVTEPTTLYGYGTIAPGDNGIGTLTVNGNVVFEPNSVYSVEVSNTTADKLHVNGGVTIDGGTVQVDSQGTILGEHDYEIIAANVVSGEFDVLDTALLDFTVTDANLGYDPNSVWLHISAANFNDPNIARTYNQRQVAGALQEIAGEEADNPVTGALQQLPDASGVRRAYDELSGQTRPALGPLTAIGTSRFLGTVTSRLQTMQGGLVDTFSAGSLLAMAGPDTALDSGSTYDTSPQGQTFGVGKGTSTLADASWGLWARTYGLYGDRETEKEAPGYEYSTFGGSVGLDYQFSDMLLGGLVVGVADGDVDFAESRDNTEFDAKYVGLYGSAAWDKWYLDAVGTIARLEYETQRFVDLLGERLSASFNGYELAGYAELGRNWQLAPDLLLQPLASVQYSYLTLDDYTEYGGASALSFDEQTYESVKGSLGARLTRNLIETAGDFQAKVQLRGRWVHEFGDNRASVDTSFASNPAAVFTVRDNEVDRDSAVLGVGLSGDLNKHTRVYVDYDTRFNSDESVHVVSGSLQYRW